VGSYGAFAEFKASVLNEFVATHHVQTVIELGCGDGNQLGLANYRSYLGFDVSSTAISKCRDLFESDEHKSFRLMSEYNGDTADLALSLDVIFHLVEDGVFERYMRMLFEASSRYVIIYSSDFDDDAGHHGTHVRHRKFTRWIHEHLHNWKLVEHLPNRYPYRGDYRTGSFAEFFVYEKT
jgi:SAM-dependent methyltransferase